MKRDYAPREYHGPTKSVKKGLFIIYTGNGKGKTTAGYGTVLRALGRGMRVAIIQFIKGRWVSGEVMALRKFKKQVTFLSFGEDFTWKTKNLQRDKARARVGWKACVRLLRENRHQVFLFDELLYVLKYRFLSSDKVLKDIIRFKSPEAHLILTGREATQILIDKADLVSEVHEIKHPLHKGIVAQSGVDY